MSPAPTQLRAIDRLKSAVRKGLLKKTVKLANGENFDVHYRPMTAAEQQAVIDDCGENTKLYDYRLQVFIRRALDESGQRLFSKADLPSLKNEVEARDLESLVAAVCDDQGEQVDMKSPQE